MNLYESLGKAVAERDQEIAKHVATIGLLGKLKRGEVSLDDLTISDDGHGWAVASPASPAENNGASLVEAREAKIDEIRAKGQT